MKNFLLLLFMIMTTMVDAQTVFKPTSLIIGKGSDVDMTYVVDRSGINDPKLKWDGTTFKWYFSNDGTTFGEMVSKSYVDTAVAGATIPDADATTKGKIQLAGDLSGTAASPTVPALATKAPLASPVFTGTPVAPTASAGTNNTQIATTAYVDGAVSSATIPDADATTKGKIQLAGDLGGTAASPTVPGLALKAPLASPVLTGTPVAPTATAGTNTTQIATTAFVTGAISTATIPDADATTKGKVQLAGDLGGTAASPTVPGLALKAPIASPTLTGDPKVPTPTAGDSDTSIASTAFVANAITTATDPTKISGPASATDNAIVRFDGTTGKLAQDSVATVSDTGVLTATSFSAPGTGTTSAISGLSFNNNQISSSSGSNLDLNTTGSTDLINLKRKVLFAGKKTHTAYNDPTVGSAQYLEDHTTSFVRLTGSGLVSVKGLIAGNSGDLRTIVNETGADVVFLNESTAASSTQRINTGTGSNLRVKNNGSIQVMYDTVSTKWHVVSGASAAGAYSDPDIFYTQTFENVTTSDFAYLNGVVIDTGSQIHGINSAYIGHGLSTLYIGESLNLDTKFRGRNLTMKLSGFSDASPSNITVDIGCTTTNDVLSNGTLSNMLVTSDEQYVYFDVPSTCTNLKYRVNGLADAGKNTYIDDVTFFITKFKTPTSALVKIPDSFLYATGNGGQALTAGVTLIPFSTTVQSSGSGYTWSGTLFTALEDGFFEFNVSVLYSAASSSRIGIYKNNAIYSPLNDNTASSNVKVGTIKIPLVANDTISIRTMDAGATLSNTTAHWIAISKEGQLTQAVVNKNQKIKIPTSTLRFEGTSSRGSTDQAIPVWTFAKISGDAFTYTTTAANGTVVVMQKSGLLCTQVSAVHPSASTIYVTRNESTSLAVNPTVSSEILATGTGASTPFHAYGSNCELVTKNDIIRTSTGVTPSANAVNIWELTFQEQEVQVSVSNTLPQFTDTDTVVKAAGNSGQAITVDVTNIPFTTVSDTTGGAWTGSTFIVPSDGLYTLNGSVSMTTGATRAAELYVDNALYRRIGNGSGGTLGNYSFFIEEKFTQGQTLSVRSAGSGGTLANDPKYHFINITKIGKPNVTGVDVTPFIDLSQIGSKGHVGEVIFSIDPVAPTNFISALNSTISISSGDQYRKLYEKIWAMAGTSTTAGDPFRISSAKGTTASADWFAGKTITIDFSTNEVFIRALAASGRNLGSYQASDNLSHGHSLLGFNGGGAVQMLGFSTAAGVMGASTGTGGGYYTNAPTGGGAYVQATGNATEARPKNVALVMYIRYAGVEENALITTTQSFSTDTASLMFKSTAVTSSDPVGTFSTYSIASSTNTKTVCATAPTQTTSDMNANGLLIYTRAYNATSTCNQPAAFTINVGKNFKGTAIAGYKSSGKTTQGTLDIFLSGANTQYGLFFKEYNESTGLLVLDAGTSVITTITGAGILFSDNSSQSSGYITFNASKTPTLSGISFAAPRVAWLKDVKASGTAGGTSVAATWNTRVLNTEDDQSDFLTLSGNQFTLPAGEYMIEATAPAFSSQGHKLRLRNITDASTALVGTSAYNSNSAGYAQTDSVLIGRFVITGSKVFELQHYITAALATNGLGATTTSGESEVYSQLKITKVK